MRHQKVGASELHYFLMRICNEMLLKSEACWSLPSFIELRLSFQPVPLAQAQAVIRILAFVAFVPQTEL